MNCIVLYGSQYGTTERYAKWIAEQIECEVYSYKNFKPENLQQYDTIILGGGLYAGGLSGIKILTENYDKIKRKNIIVFTCGLADPNDKDNVVHIREGLQKAMGKELFEQITLFHLRGGIDYKKLSLKHKAMMAMLHKMLKRKDYNSLRQEDKDMIDTYGGMVDFVSLETALPMIQYIKQLAIANQNFMENNHDKKISI